MKSSASSADLHPMHQGAHVNESSTSPIYQTFPPRDLRSPEWGSPECGGAGHKGRHEREDSFDDAVFAENLLFFPADAVSSPSMDSGRLSAWGPSSEDPRIPSGQQSTAYHQLGGDGRLRGSGGARCPCWCSRGGDAQGPRRGRRKKRKKGMSRLHVILNYSKCALGVGCFALPKAYATVGLLWSVIGTVVLAVLAAYTSVILAWTELELLAAAEAQGASSSSSKGKGKGAGRHSSTDSTAGSSHLSQPPSDGDHHDEGGGRLDEEAAVETEGAALEVRRRRHKTSRRVKTPRLTYPEVGRAACPRATCGGVNVVSASIYVTLLLTSLGVCAAYVGFIGETLGPVLRNETTGGIIPGLSQLQIEIYVVLPAVVLLSLLRSFKYIAFTSILGDVAVLAGFAGVVIEGFLDHRLTFDPAAGQVSRPAGVPQFIGTIAFCFAIHMVVLPMSQSLRPNYTTKSSSSSSSSSTRTAGSEASGRGSQGGSRASAPGDEPPTTQTHLVAGDLAAPLLKGGRHTHMPLQAFAAGGGVGATGPTGATGEGAVAGTGAGTGPTGPPRPWDDHGFRCVAVISYLFVGVLNLVFGLLCWLLFGDHVQGNVLKNIGTAKSTGAARVIISAIKVTMSVAMLFTVPMILAVGREIVESNMLQLSCSRRCKDTVRNGTRIGLVAVVFGIVIGIPGFGNMVSLVGGFAACFTGFILPPILWVSARPSTGCLARWSHYVIAVFGTGLLVSSTYFTLVNIAKGN